MAYQTAVPNKTVSTGAVSRTDQNNKLILLSNSNYLSYWESSEPTVLNTVGVDVPTVTKATRGQLMAFDGTLIGASFIISPPESLGTFHSDLVALPNGQFAAIYVSTKGANVLSSTSIYAQFYSNDGTAVGSRVTLNSTAANLRDFPDITLMPDGRLFATWTEFNTSVGSNISSDIFGRFFDASGTLLGSTFKVDSTVSKLEYSSKSVALKNGNIFNFWIEASNLYSNKGDVIKGQITGSDGKTVISQFNVNAVNNVGLYLADYAQLNDGRFLVTWSSELSLTTQIHGQVFNADGSKAGSELTLFGSQLGYQTSTATAGLADGRFIIASQDLANQKIVFQVLLANGQPSSESFSIPAWQGKSYQYISMVSGPDNKLVISGLNQNNLVVSSTTIDLNSYIGSAVDDNFIGSEVFGDTINGGRGNDTIDGKGGIDKVVYSGNQPDYIITKFKSYYTIIDARPFAPDGFDSVRNVELFQFGNRTISADLLTKPLRVNAVNGVVHVNNLSYSSTASGSLNYISSLNYIASYADLIKAFGNDAAAGLSHFTSSAAKEKRVTTFNGLDYVASYADLSAAFKGSASLNAISDAGAGHFISNGSKENRTITFNGLDYIASHDDLSAAFGANNDAGAAHFISSGRAEGRTTTFNGLAYIASYLDLMNALGANEQAGAAHYIQAGRNEERVTTFNSLDYIASHSDLIAAFGASSDAGSTHYINSGRNEGRTTSFDGLNYIASHGDLIDAFGTNEQAGAAHYISTYATEHRAVTFDGLSYIAGSQDLMTAFGTNTDAGTSHYITTGHNELRNTVFNVSGYISAHADLAGKYSSDTQFLTAYINTFISTGQVLT